MRARVSVCLSVFQSKRQAGVRDRSIGRSVYLLIYLSVYLSICQWMDAWMDGLMDLPARPSARLSIYLSVHGCICLSVYRARRGREGGRERSRKGERVSERFLSPPPLLYFPHPHRTRSICLYARLSVRQSVLSAYLFRCQFNKHIPVRQVHTLPQKQTSSNQTQPGKEPCCCVANCNLWESTRILRFCECTCCVR